MVKVSATFEPDGAISFLQITKDGVKIVLRAEDIREMNETLAGKRTIWYLQPKDGEYLSGAFVTNEIKRT